jgi:serine/threonine-protein kinase
VKGYFDIEPSEWLTLRSLLDTLLELAPAERATWVDGLGAEYEAFKPRLRSLMARASSSATLPPDTLPKVETAQFLAGPPDSEQPHAGRSVGPYRLIRLLGEGGMGAVWLAERSDMLQRRQVALKLPRLLTGRAALAERLAREREILAALNHPNIARLYDAGIAADGQPYLALEYVEGERIDAYCRRKVPDVPARLRLFLQVARAVAHAHENLVVHRDLKPANILVTEAGDVRLLDFGIARLLEDRPAQETELTQLAGRALTPEYAAPEQILGNPIGTTADVYALGVVLYELLADTRPYKLKRDSRAALEDAILQAEPAAPSAMVADARLRRRLRGDLDTIVLKALKKLPAERYGTVEAFAEDIERFLANRPTQAQPDRRIYRLRKFVARNRLAVGAAGAVAAALVAGAGVAVWQANAARVEQQRAEQVKELIGAIFQDVDPLSRSGDAPVSALDLLAHARERLDRAASLDAASRAELLQILGQSYWGLGEYKTAERLSGEAIAAAATALPGDDARLVRARLVRAASLHALGARDEARRIVDKLIAELEDPAGGLAVKMAALCARAHLQLASFEINEGRARGERALAAAQRAATLVERFALDRELALAAYKTLAVVFRWRGQTGPALENAQRAYELALAVYGRQGRHARTLEAQNEYGRSLARVGRIEEAIALMKAAAERATSLYGAKHVMVQHFAGTLGSLQLDHGLIKEGLATLQAAAAVDVGEVKVSATYQGSRQFALARAYLAARQTRAARAIFEKALASFAAATPRGNLPVQAEQEHALVVALDGEPARAVALLDPLVEEQRRGDKGHLQHALRYRGTAQRLQGNPRQALQDLNEAIELLTALDAKADAPAALRVALADVLKEAGLAQLALGDPAAAIARLEEAHKRFAALQPQTTPARAEASTGLARAFLQAGQPERAEKPALAALEFWDAFDPSNRGGGEAQFWLARVYEALGRAADARRSYAAARTLLERSHLPEDARLADLARSAVAARR